MNASWQAVVHDIGRVVQSNEATITLLLSAVLANGHVLLEDVPGSGKTLLAKAVARTLGVSFKRIQMTPDLLPADITGTTVWDGHEFRFMAGPLFTHILLADELNRATPRTQAALLEAMAEQQVTVASETFPLSLPFVVIATQNPLDHQGTFPLPLAQLDRFLVRLRMGTPDARSETSIVMASASSDVLTRINVSLISNIALEQQRARETRVHVDIARYAVELARATRAHPALAMGAGTRGPLAMISMARGLAYLKGRGYVIPEDVDRVSWACLAHRLLLTREAYLDGLTLESVWEEVRRGVPIPTEPPHD